MYSLGLFVQLYCGMFIDQYAKKRNQSVDVIRTKWYHPQMVPPNNGPAQNNTAQKTRLQKSCLSPINT